MSEVKASTAKKYLVLSDLHFGTPQTSVNNPIALNALRKYLSDHGPWAEVIFSGDLLDLNLSTMTKAIEGDNEQGITGFRKFMADLTSPPLPVDQWVYIPGNHDYHIWDLLSIPVVSTQVLASGKPLGTIPMPYMAGQWRGTQAFISGVFPPAEISKVLVDYPIHPVDCSGKRLVLTHGHYLDPSQTQAGISKNLAATPQNIQKAVREMFIETAQYQAIAHAVSYTYKSRRLVDLLVGPDNLWSRFKRVLLRSKKGAFASPLRDQPINEQQLRAIEFFLLYCCGQAAPPHTFIFGHTHSPGKSSTKQIPGERRYPKDNIEVYNAGSFYPSDKILGTFLEIAPGASDPVISVSGIDNNGNIIRLF